VTQLKRADGPSDLERHTATKAAPANHALTSHSNPLRRPRAVNVQVPDLAAIRKRSVSDKQVACLN
jgi:hypothetical protein